ncbi:neural cell adhesion molecule L1.1-like isoform X2 [Melanotaenia boesemani]|uniref:neural cell adhesion molecule L1.1-like isoform X2 n=1 Tax=Melanotaenia boesemani TaxID=1250792 RepID=UPI001C046DFB|nr:neural cell adhesion molecule L1.1-like isoform X2 [Melanotaenia boesemani]
MCVSQHQWMSYRGPCPPILSLILFIFPLAFLFSIAQGAIDIPKHYKKHNMSQPPELTELPTSFTAFSREDIVLPCEASGNPPPTFRWIKDGEQFGLEQTGSGTLRAQDQDLAVSLESYAGSYRCYASNTLGTAMTQTVEVIVEPQPVLQKQQKVHLEAYEGSSIILTCNPPKSSTPPHIHWMDKKMVHIEQNDRVMTGLDGNLYFSNLWRNDSRKDYICNAQYAAARTILPETAIRLTVKPSNDVNGRKPHFFHSHGSHTSVQALRGHSVTLECIPKGLPTPRVEWIKKDGRLDETSSKVENHHRWLSFNSITQADEGEYQCKASNSYGSTTHSFTVTVEAAPYWLKTPRTPEPQNQMYAPGETVRLDCMADGIPPPTITWSINGQRLAEVDPDPRRSLTSNALILRDVEFQDTAVYQCEATNKHGSILLNTNLFVVELPPQILSSDGRVYRVIEDGDIKLHCESFGSPRPQITWEDEVGSPLLLDPRASLLTNGTIELLNVSHKDSGGYTCSVKDSNISITANLVVFNKTRILTGPTDVRIRRGSTAFLDCDFYKDPLLHMSWVVWKKDGHVLQESPDNKYTMFENRTLKVTNVQPEDTAHYTCEVKTELDQADATGSITVVAPPDPPTSLSFSNIVGNSLTLSWIPGSSHNSIITVFIVEAQEKAQSENGKQSRESWEKWNEVIGDFNHVQLILRPFCTYRFRVTAVNAIDKGRASEPSENYSTQPSAPDKNPSGVRSNSTQPGTLVITWDEMENRLHNGPDFHYKVFWREVKGTNVQWQSSYVKRPPYLVNNTRTYTPFEIKVQAVNKAGKGPDPIPTVGHSGEDEPEEAPSGVSSTVMNTTVTVTWNQAQKVRGLLLGYKIYFSRPRSGQAWRSLRKKHHVEEQEKQRDEDNWVVEVKGMATSKEVGGLRLFSKYVLWVTAFNSKGESPRSVPHHFNTPEGAPGPPASLRFESPTEMSLILLWTPPLETNGILLGYMVQYQQEVESRNKLVKMQTISDPNVNHILLEDLDPQSYYIFKVIARTAAGDGPPITRRGATLLEGVPPTNITIVSSNTSFNLSWVPGERDRNHGFHIYYLKKDAGGRWQESEVVNSTKGFYSLTDLHPGMQYHLKILHGNITHWEDTVWTLGPVPSEMPSGFATQGWLIGLISAVVLLLLILLILCFIKHSKGGKYAVKEREEKQVDSEVRPMKDETFGEYSILDEKHSDSQPSLCEDSKVGSDDSLAEYGDSVDIQFNEDGSFIGQYSGRGPAPHGNESSDPASPVNAIPPPPIAPSMSSILNRPS